MSEPVDPYKLTSVREDGSRIGLIPGEVQGFFRRHRTRLHLVLLFIFLGLPWLRWNDQQLILLNIPGRQFVFFGISFRAHEAPLLFFLIATFVLAMVFVTAIWGRVWCGWACPQTVFIDSVYRRIEQWTEGTYLQRRELREASWSLNKLRRTGLKWILFVLVSSLFAHSFVAYFTGSRELMQMMTGSPAQNWNYFLWVSFFTLLLLFDFTWFREQFCVIMCPYGRLQSVLLEPSSLAIAYDEKRGEPRRGQSTALPKTGDCVSCNRCVSVCPTGIDIRNGLQMECIACTACVDACDEIMTKLKKPTGLISYRTLDGSPFRIWKLKTLVYGALIFTCVTTLAYNLRHRESINIAVLRGLDSPYTISKNAEGSTLVLNHFRLHLSNQSSTNSEYALRLSESDRNRGLELTVAQNPLKILAGGNATWHLFVRAPLLAVARDDQRSFKISITDSAGETFERELDMIGPQP